VVSLEGEGIVTIVDGDSPDVFCEPTLAVDAAPWVEFDVKTAATEEDPLSDDMLDMALGSAVGFDHEI
jgi:hypothetical protein